VKVVSETGSRPPGVFQRKAAPSVRRFRDTTLKEECKGDYPQALQSMLKALDRAEDVIQN
jgi:hypothetical protein